jgi:hypothetical protein
VSKAARLLDLSAQRVRNLVDNGTLAAQINEDGHRYCHRPSVLRLALERQVHQLMTGARKRGPKGPRRRPVPPKAPDVYAREFEAATA